MKFMPLAGWPHPVTPDWERRRAPFRAAYGDTLDLLAFEVSRLGESADAGCVVQVDVDPSQFTLKGLPMARARWYSARVSVQVATGDRVLTFATDRFDYWQDNLRAIALGMEALRKVDRYGLASATGGQYAGFAAIESAPADPWSDGASALAWMRKYAAELGITDADSLDAGRLYRAMARKMHPDQGGPAADWHRLDRAWTEVKP
jgi:hypothetical protein